MKKKILIAVVGIVCLLSMVLAGCSNIKIENVDADVINVMQDAINNSQVNYSTYYIRERYNTDPKNLARNEMTEVMLNVQADDKSIEGIDNTKINLSIKYTKGITEYTDSFIIGQSLSKNVKAKSAKAEDYKLYVFENYKKSKTAPVFTRTCEEILAEDVYNYVTETGYALNDYTMASILAPLKELTQDDIKMAEKGNVKQGKVTTYIFEVIKDGHKYKDMGQLKLMLYTDKKVTRVMSLSSVDEKYTLDVMYQGPKIDIPNYDNYSESDNQITLTSDRSDGLVALYSKDENTDEISFVAAINPLEIEEFKLEVGEGDDKITYTYKITTVESAVNWDYEYTEIVIRLFGTDKDGNEVEYDGSNYEAMHYFVQTKNIVKTKKDFSSMIPLAAVAVAVIALIIALIALFKIKKQNKELTKQIKAISGETEEKVIIDAQVETTEEVEEAKADTTETVETIKVDETTEKTEE